MKNTTREMAVGLGRIFVELAKFIPILLAFLAGEAYGTHNFGSAAFLIIMSIIATLIAMELLRD